MIDFTSHEQTERIETLARLQTTAARQIAALRRKRADGRGSDRTSAGYRWQIGNLRYSMSMWNLERRYLRGVADNVRYLRDAGCRYRDDTCHHCHQRIADLYYRDRGLVWIVANGTPTIFCNAAECDDAAQQYQAALK